LLSFIFVAIKLSFNHKPGPFFSSLIYYVGISMNSKIVFLLVMLLALSGFATEPNVSTPDTVKPNISMPDTAEICFFSKDPPAGMQFEKVKRIKEAKGVYGGVSEVLPGFLSSVQEWGCNAVIRFTAAQRFSILPWRFMSPVAYGWGVKLENKKGLTCAEMGGKTMKEIMAEHTNHRQKE